jgi:hypothetical protein
MNPSDLVSELTKGLIFSQRVMLALIDKGLSRQAAYELVQRNSTKAWNSGRNFLSLLKADPEVVAKLPPEELEPLFDGDGGLGASGFRRTRDLDDESRIRVSALNGRVARYGLVVDHPFVERRMSTRGGDLT